GAAGSAKRYAATSSARCPVARESRKQSAPTSLPFSRRQPVSTGLYAATETPRRAIARRIAHVTSVFPAPVSVPVTNIPRRATRCFLFANESAGRAFDRARDRNDELLEQRSGQRKR